LFPHQPAGLAQALSSKREMYELCQEHDIPRRWSFFPESELEVPSMPRRLAFRWLAKVHKTPAMPRILAPRAIARIAPDSSSANRLMESADGHKLMLQEYGPEARLETVWMFNGYFDGRSNARSGFTGKKIRQSPPYTGATSWVCAWRIRRSRRRRCA